MKKMIWQVAVLILMGSAVLHADPVTITINNTPLSGVAGATLTFDATMTNTTDGLLNLVGDDFGLTAPFTIANVNDSAFLLSWPLTLAPGASFGSAALFDITIPLGTAPGIYGGTFSLFGGPGDLDQNLLGTATFEVDVTKTTTATPEPGTFALMMLGLLGLAFVGRNRLTAHGIRSRANLPS